MMETRVLVHVDIDGAPILVGRLWARTRRDKESASFEYDEGWLAHPGRFSLEPALAYDLNPVPTDVKPRVLSTTIDLDDGTPALPVAFGVAPYFGIGAREARASTSEVGAAVATWRREASRQGVRAQEIDRMASAFEHEDLRAARKAR